MRQLSAYLFLATAAGLFLAPSLTQADDEGGNTPGERTERGPDDGPPPPGRGRRPARERRGPGGPGHHGPPPIIVALDADADGMISASEIEGAATALKTLDKNQDGDLTMEELHPGRHGGPEGAFGNRERSRRSGPGQRGERGSRRNREGRGNRDGRPSPEAFVDRVMQSDADGNGEISLEEAPERMQRRFDRIDEDGSGGISRAELEKAAKRFGGRQGGQGRDRKRPALDDSDAT